MIFSPFRIISKKDFDLYQKSYIDSYFKYFTLYTSFDDYRILRTYNIENKSFHSINYNSEIKTIAYKLPSISSMFSSFSSINYEKTRFYDGNSFRNVYYDYVKAYVKPVYNEYYAKYILNDDVHVNYQEWFNHSYQDYVKAYVKPVYNEYYNINIATQYNSLLELKKGFFGESKCLLQPTAPIDTNENIYESIYNYDLISNYIPVQL